MAYSPLEKRVLVIQDVIEDIELKGGLSLSDVVVPVTRNINGKSLLEDIVITKNDVGLGNVDNESKRQMFKDAVLTGNPKAPTPNLDSNDTSIATTEFVNKALVNSNFAVVPVSRTINGKQLKDDIELTPDDVNSVPNTRKVNNKPLTSDISVTKADVGLGNVTNESKTTMFTSPTFTGTVTAPTPTIGDNTTKVATTEFVTTTVNNKTSITGNSGSATKLQNPRKISGVDFDGTKDITLNASSVGAVPLSRTINGKTLSSDITLVPSDIGLGSVISDLANKYNKSEVYNKVETDGRIESIIGSAPEALDTLQEIAKSLNNDSNFAGTMVTQLSGKVDKVSGKGLSENDFTSAYKNKIDTLSDSATNVQKSTINGNIKINGVENTVYTHPSGTNPHGTTKADVGLGNVVNESKTTMFTSPTFTGIPLAPTPVVGTNNKQIATTEFVKIAIDNINFSSDEYVPIERKINGKALSTDISITKADLGLGNVTNESKTTMFNSPVLTGVPTAPTAPVGTGTDQIATTKFVQEMVANVAVDGATLVPASRKVNGKTLESDITITKADLGLGNVVNESKTTMFSNPTFTGTVVAPTQEIGDNSTKVATTSFVSNSINNIEIGGRNLLSNSAFIDTVNLSGWSINTAYTNIDTATKFNGHNSLKISVSGLSADQWIGATSTGLSRRTFKAGETVTLSAWYYVSDKSTLEDRISIGIQGKIGSETSAREFASGQIPVANVVQGVWTKHTLTYTFPSDATEVIVRCWIKRNGTIWFSDFKFEIGDKATDWTPSIEDVDNKINSITVQTLGAIPNTRKVNGKTLSNDISLVASDVGLGNVTNESKTTMFTSPTFTGTPTAPTPTAGDNSTKVATTSFVNTSVNAHAGNTTLHITSAERSKWNHVANGNTFTDTRAVNELPSVYRSKGVGEYNEFKTGATIGISDTLSGGIYIPLKTLVSYPDKSGGAIVQIAYCQNDTIYTRRGNVDDTSWGAWAKQVDEADLTSHTSNTTSHITSAERTTWNAKANLASPTFTGTPIAPTATAGTNTTQIATTAFVTTAIANKTSITGNSGTATKLATARTIALSGGVTGSASFDGSANVTISATLGNIDGGTF